MATNKGQIYEDNLTASLKKYNLQRKSFRGAANNPDLPDAELHINGKNYIVEVKMELKDVDYGQATLGYNLKDRKWFINLQKGPTESAKHMKLLLDSKNIANYINAHASWGKNIPVKFLKDVLSAAEIKREQETFKDIYFGVTYDLINSYYKMKGVNYISIGGANHGLYKLSASDPAKLGVPLFNPTNVKVRIRMKGENKNGKYTYRFSTALVNSKTTSLQKSTINLENPEDLKMLSEKNVK